MLHTVLIAFALLALLAVIFEEVIHIHKAKTTLFFGTLSWLLLYISAGTTDETAAVTAGLNENILEIAGLWLFLLAAMTFVAYLNKKGMVANLIYKFLPSQITERRLLFLVALFSFLFSSLADNITATLIAVALVQSLKLPSRTTRRFMVLVVFAVNSGGVALITGDVTTLMIFLQGKVTILNLMLLSVPSFFAVALLALLLSRGISNAPLVIEGVKQPLGRADKRIGVTFLCTILGTIAGNVLFGIPPILFFLFGLSAMFLIAHFYNERITSDPIFDYIRIIEFETLLFFLGVLLIVGVLKEIGALHGLLGIYDVLPVEVANYVMGLLSAMIDNVPLTAALLKSGIEMGTAEWLLLTYSVGVGGSLLIIGSAAGIVAMSKVPGLTFGIYLRYFPVLLIAYTIGALLTYLLGQLLT